MTAEQGSLGETMEDNNMSEHPVAELSPLLFIRQFGGPLLSGLVVRLRSTVG